MKLHAGTLVHSVGQLQVVQMCENGMPNASTDLAVRSGTTAQCAFFWYKLKSKHTVRHDI